MNISVIISTKDREKKLVSCLESILKNTTFPLEIVILDQSTTEETEKKIKNLRLPSLIKYYRMQVRNLSLGRNFGINHANGDVLVFADDDCLVDKHWLERISESFKRNKEIVGLFGKVMSYKPSQNREKYCPCTFLKKKKMLITKPCVHSENIGFGNNMAFRRKIFKRVGGFKEWLGIGSIGKSAEDAEFALRVLLNGYRLLYNPKVKVYHNRWLTEEQMRGQSLSYSCGEVACYGYFTFQGHEFAKKVVKKSFKDSLTKMKNYLKSLLKPQRPSFNEGLYILKELIFRLRGAVVAFWFSKREPIDFVPAHKL